MVPGWCYAPRALARLLVAMFLSGAASLMYQVAWTRRLITATSATATAQALVLAVFMAGLGLGAALAGRRAAGVRRPLHGYAGVELAAAALALASIPVIDGSSPIRTALQAAGAPASAALSAQLAALAVFLLLPTTLLGASLPLLLEHLERASSGGSSRSGRVRLTSWIYGVNTFGACAGAVISGFYTVEHLGLSRTLAAGAGLALLAAITAVAGAGVAPGPPSPDPAASTPARDPAAAGPATAAGGDRIDRTVLFAALLGGFIGLAAEVVWTRLLSLFLMNTVYAFTEVLAGVLAGIGAGAALAGLLVRTAGGLDRGAARRRLLDLAAYLSAMGAVVFALLPHVMVAIIGDRELGHRIARGTSPMFAALPALLLVVPAALGAATLPLLVGASQRSHGSRALGELYALNTAGSVLGSALAGFLLLPGVGLRGTSALVALSAALLSALLFFAADSRAKATRVGGLALATSVLLSFSLDLPLDLYREVVGGARVLEFREGRSDDVLVTEDAIGLRRLWINSNWVATTARRQHSGLGPPHRVLGHIPALSTPSPRVAAGIALGTGQTFAAVLHHGVDELHCVEINPGVIELSRRQFGDYNERLLENPKVIVHNDDGRAFLRSTELTFDLIVLEPLQAWSAGTSSLYSREFYEDAARVLRPGGVIGQWIPFYGQSPDDTRSMVKSALEVFPEASLWLDRKEGILILSREPFRLSPETFAERIAARGLGEDLRSNAFGDAADVLALFLAGPRGLAAWVEGAPVLEDDRPFLEFSAARALGTGWYAPILASVAKHREPPRVYASSTATTSLALLDRAGHLRDTLVEARLAQQTEGPEAAALLYEAALDELSGSQLLATYWRDFILEWGGDATTAARGASAVEQAFLRGISRDPDLGEAMVNLAQLYRRLGRTEEARVYLERARAIPRVRATAERILSAAGPAPAASE